MKRLALVFALAACAPGPSEPFAVVIGAPPPLPTVAAATPAEAREVELAVFAEGWGLDFGATRGGVTLFDVHGEGVGVVTGDEVTVKKRPFQGLFTDGDARIHSLFGDAAAPWAMVPRGGREQARLFHLVSGRWTDARAVKFEGYKSVYTGWWSRGRALGLLDASPASSVVVDFDAAAPGAAVTLGDAPKLEVDATMKINAVATTARGDVVVLGYVDDDRRQHAVHVFPGGKMPGQVVMLPPVTTSVDHIDAAVCLSPDGTIHVVRDVTTRDATPGKNNLQSGAQLASYVGGSWVRSELPRSTAYFNLRGCAVAADGAIWTLWDANSHIHPGEAHVERLAKGDWRRITLPTPSTLEERTSFSGGKLTTSPITSKPHPLDSLSAQGIWADDAGVIWIRAARLSGGDRVRASGMHSTPVPERFLMLRSGKARAEPFSWDAAVGSLDELIARIAGKIDDISGSVAGPDCKGTVWVQIVDAPAWSSSAYGYPELAAVARGRPDLAKLHYVEALLNGVRGVGVLTPGWAQGKALADKFTRARPKEPPARTICAAAPKNARRIAP